MLADIVPTAYEVGVLNGMVRPGDTVAIVGAAKLFGADVTINNSHVDPLAAVRELTEGLGADVAIEAVGTPATFELVGLV